MIRGPRALAPRAEEMAIGARQPCRSTAGLKIRPAKQRWRRLGNLPRRPATGLWGVQWRLAPHGLRGSRGRRTQCWRGVAVLGHLGRHGGGPRQHAAAAARVEPGASAQPGMRPKREARHRRRRRHQRNSKGRTVVQWSRGRPARFHGRSHTQTKGHGSTPSGDPYTAIQPECGTNAASCQPSTHYAQGSASALEMEAPHRNHRRWPSGPMRFSSGTLETLGVWTRRLLRDCYGTTEWKWKARGRIARWSCWRALVPPASASRASAGLSQTPPRSSGAILKRKSESFGRSFTRTMRTTLVCWRRTSTRSFLPMSGMRHARRWSPNAWALSSLLVEMVVAWAL
mmetsp:Transcript_18853/g.51872  ORF Transcript_18853/g.51872 Transcript_18853/m.51872 type:complete len:342 (-) Transcript_18853:214-1239(-)